MINWATKKLGEVADILMGQSPSSSTYNQDGTGLPFFQGKAEFGNLYPKVDKYCSSPIRIAKPEDILLSVRAPVGPINMAQEKICIGRGLSAIRARKDKSDQWYLYYLLKQYENGWDGSSGSTFQAINKTVIENLEIPFPNLNIQEKIVERLDAIRKAQELCDTQIFKTEELFRSVFSIIFKDNQKNWKEVTLSEISSRLGDGLHGTPKYVLNGDYYFINGNNLEDGVIKYKENTKRVSSEEFIKYKKDLSDRTILVSINGTLGNVAFYNNEKVVLGKSVCYLNLIDEVDKNFVKYFLSSRYFMNYARNEATGATIKNFSLKSMRAFKVYLPSIKLQKEIVKKLDAIQDYKKLLLKQKSLLKELFASVLYKSMNGEMD